MEGLLDAQRLALGAWHRACEGQPALHAHQLLALQREQALCAASVDIDDYLQRSDGGFELCRAAWLDRVTGRLQAARTGDDIWAARAALAGYRGALAARDAAGWSDALVAASAAEAPWQQRAAEAACGLVRTLQHLLLHHTSTPGLADHLGHARVAWRAWCDADAPAAHALWHGHPLPPRVSLRLPWTTLPPPLAALLRTLPEPPAPDDADDGDGDPWVAQALAQAAWRQQLSQAGSAAPCAGRPALSSTLASAEQALRPWRLLAQPAAGATTVALTLARVAQAILDRTAGATNGPAVQRRLIESGLSAALAAAPVLVQLDTLEARQREWPQPLLAAHAAALRRSLAQARGDTEVEWLVAQAEACLAVEADWQDLLFGVALSPLQAALNRRLMRPLLGDGVDAAAQRAFALAQQALGVDARAALQLPWLQDFVTRNAVCGLASGGGTDIAGRGEAGHALLPSLRAWRDVCAADGRPVAANGPGLLSALDALLEQAGGTPAPELPIRLQLWGRAEPAGHGGELLSAPARPALPGWLERAAAAGAL